MGPRNPTGFDMSEFKRAAHPKSSWAKRDPWARYEAWRYTGPFSRWNRFKGGFPGLGVATVAFAGYCAWEHFFEQDHHHTHAQTHR